VDTITGTVNNDTIIATNTTLSSSDSVNGGNGTDTLLYIDTSTTGTAPSSAATYTSIENINIRNNSTTVTTPAVAEVTQVVVGDLALAQTLVINGQTFTSGKEVTKVTFTDVADTGTVIFDGITVTATGGTATAADVATAFATATTTNFAVVTGAQNVKEVTTKVGNAVTFTAVAAGATNDLAVTGTAAATATAVVLTQGANEIASASVVAQALASGTSVGSISVTGTQTSAQSATVLGNVVTFTAKTAGDLTDITVGGTGAANLTVLTQGVAASTSSNAYTVSASQFAGAQTLNSDISTGGVTFSNVAAGQTLGKIGGSANLTGNHGSTVTTAAVAISGGSTDGTIVLGGSGLTTANISSSGVANTTGFISSAVTTLKTFNITANTNLTLGTDAGVGLNSNGAASTLNISGGAASVNIRTIDAEVLTVNASGLTAGGVTATMSGEATLKVTGGAGNDIITTGSVLTTGSVDAGAGTGDRLIVANTADLATATLGAKYTNFEQLQANNGVALNNVVVDLDNISGITSIRISDGTGTTEVQNLTAAQAGAITVVAANATGAITIGVKGATTPGQVDTVALTIDDGSSTVNTLALGTPVMAGVEKLSINAVDNVTIAALTASPNLDAITLTGAATQSITTGAVSTANFAINGSAATGVLTLDATNYGTNGVSLTGGSAADVLTGSAQADVISGNAGNDNISGLAGIDVINGGDGTDTINGGIGADNLTGGAGVDTFRYVAAGAGNGDNFNAGVANVDRITDFTAGTDKFSFGIGANEFLTGLTLTVNTVIVLNTAQTIANAATLADVFAGVTPIAASVNATVQGAVVTVSAGAAAGTYLYVNDNNAANLAAEDMLINITGITGTLAASDFVFA